MQVLYNDFNAWAAGSSGLLAEKGKRLKLWNKLQSELLVGKSDLDSHMTQAASATSLLQTAVQAVSGLFDATNTG